MIRSSLSVSAGLACIAVLFAALWIGFGPRPQGGQVNRASAVVPLSKQQRTGLDSKGQSIRTITPGSTSDPKMAATVPTGAAPPAATPTPSAANPGPSTQPGLPDRQTGGAPAVSRDAGIPPATGGDAPVTAGGTVDLNTASVDQLNALGAGMIGKRIVEFRPYASPDELLTRRVLKRADYDAIRNAITVR